MDFVPNDFLVFLIRWLHVIAGISWIGNSFYFMWLDANLKPPPSPNDQVEGSLWMVHSGGFYQVERRRIGPGSMPAMLHWFKWEATFTWLTGFFLLSLVFYARDAAMLIDPAIAEWSPMGAMLLSLAILAVSWLVYDVLWNSPLAKHTLVVYAVSLVLTGGLIVFLSQNFSGRGAFIHLGAVFGTLMVLNVWVRILPSQRAMIAATERGEKPDFELGKKAKKRSTHNSYLTLPVLLTMLSTHLPEATEHDWRWLVLMTLVIFGMLCRHLMILHSQGKPLRLWLVPALASLIAVVIAIGYKPNAIAAISRAAGPSVSDDQAFAIVTSRCVTCHAAKPADDLFGPLPGGVGFESIESMRRYADRILFRVVETKTMPVLNRTQMTDEEREVLGRWASQKASQ